jgi:hypothetical protein
MIVILIFFAVIWTSLGIVWIRNPKLVGLVLIAFFVTIVFGIFLIPLVVDPNP